VSDGEWTVDGSTLRFVVPTGGLTRGDVSIPPGPLHGSVPAWGGQLSRDKGSLTVMQVWEVWAGVGSLCVSAGWAVHHSGRLLFLNTSMWGS
jgi:hypothetical protein